MFLSKFGVARHIYIPLIKRGVVDFAVSADWTPASGDCKISKDGGAAANVTNLPTAITMGNTAMWDFSLTATEMQAAQVVVMVADSATKAVEDQTIEVETYGNASAQHEFDLDTPTVVAASVTGNVGGNVTGSVGSVATGGIAAASFAAGAIDAAAIATDAIGSAELATSAVTEIQSGLATSASIAALNNLSAAQVNAEADTALADVGLTTTVTGRIDAAVSTRSIAGDAMALTSGERTTLAGVIWDRLTSAITAVGSIGKLIKDNLDATVSSRLASSSYTVPPTVGAIADAVWDEDNTTHVATDSTGQNLASAYNAAQGSYNTVFARLPANLVGGRMNASVGAVATGAITSAAFAAGAIDAAAIATDAIGAAELAPDAVAEIRTAILQQALTEGYATDGAAFTVEQALFEIAQILEERSISGTTLTVKKRDGSTSAMTFTLDSATVPTSQTRAS